MNTNHFKREQLFDPPAENVIVNYQIIFSKISTYNTFRCFYQDIIPGTMHWHIKCTDCIMKVNEDKLDLAPSSELNEILQNYSEPSVNPYLWVSVSKFNIMSFKFPIYDITDPKSYSHSWRTLLTQSLVGWILDNRPIMNDSTMWWRYDEAQIIVPISIVMKLDIRSFLISLMKNLILNSLVKKVHH